MSNKVEILSVRLTDSPNSKVRCHATIEINDCIKISGVKLIEGKNSSLFVAFPSFRTGDDKFVNLVSITSDGLKKAIQERIRAEMNKLEKEAVTA